MSARLQVSSKRFIVVDWFDGNMHEKSIHGEMITNYGLRIADGAVNFDFLTQGGERSLDCLYVFRQIVCVNDSTCLHLYQLND